MTKQPDPCNFVPARGPWSCSVHAGGYRTALDEAECSVVLGEGTLKELGKSIRDIEETQRVLRIYDWLGEEIERITHRGRVTADTRLIVAERIAARTDAA